MGLVIFFMWCLFVIPTTIVILWIVGSFIGAIYEAKAIAYLAQMYDEKNRKA